MGFRSPEFVQGIGVAGVHLHFLTTDEKHGGHVLALEAREVEMKAAVVAKVHLDLPVDDPELNEAALTPDLGGIAKVEG